VVGRALADMADSFAGVFVVATVLVAGCLVPAFLLPRRKTSRPVDPDQVPAPTLVH
jgi:hypothetical protein